MDVERQLVVRGRHTSVPPKFREAVGPKVAKLARIDPHLLHVDVELSKEHNPRQSGCCDRVEITVQRRGAVVRAEAAAADPLAALDRALDKACERLRRAVDRRHSRGSRVSRFVAAVTRSGSS